MAVDAGGKVLVPAVNYQRSAVLFHSLSSWREGKVISTAVTFSQCYHFHYDTGLPGWLKE